MATQKRIDRDSYLPKEAPGGGPDVTYRWPLDGTNQHPEAKPGADKAGDILGGSSTFGRERTPRKPTFEDGARSRNRGRR